MSDGRAPRGSFHFGGVADAGLQPLRIRTQADVNSAGVLGLVGTTQSRPATLHVTAEPDLEPETLGLYRTALVCFS